MAMMAVLIPLMGRLSNRVGPRWLLGIGATGLALGATPIFFWLTSGQIVLVSAAQTLAIVMVAAYMGPFFAIVAMLFPVSGRYTGLSLSYNIASALFGGSAPLMATLMMEWTGSTLAPGWYVSLCAVLSLMTLSTIQNENQETSRVPAGQH